MRSGADPTRSSRPRVRWNRATMGPMEKQNRAERRRSKFGGGRATEHGGWPTHLPNPVFGADPPEAAGAQPGPYSATATNPATEPAAQPVEPAPAPADDDDEASTAAKG